ncbi:hypothetical protein [Terracidiphilus sp.]|jgi:hypothetical protein|uniref:hypothetical protein n=1 Tax=Terracidiphilus sp. TaxID=1964191 RepID=UPI003C1CA6CE
MSFLRAAALPFFAFALSLAPLATGQPDAAAPASVPAPAGGPATATVPAPALASYTELLKPSLASLYATLADLKLDKWKSGNVRAEAEHDTASIVDDLNQKIPDLLKDADAAPTRTGAALPLARNFAALYDVSLRVLDAARIAAPADQAAKIQDAMNGLAAANRSLYDRLEQGSKAQEVRIGDLETKIKVQQEAAAHAVPVAPPPPACPAPAAKKPAVKRKPVAKPATQQDSGSSGSGSSTQPKPQN